jgi:hypothetical protein
MPGPGKTRDDEAAFRRRESIWRTFLLRFIYSVTQDVSLCVGACAAGESATGRYELGPLTKNLGARRVMESNPSGDSPLRIVILTPFLVCAIPPLSKSYICCPGCLLLAKMYRS